MSYRSEIVIIKDRFPGIEKSIRSAAIKTLRDGADQILRQSKRKIVAYDAIDTGNMLNSGYIRTSDFDGWPSQVMFPGIRLPAPGNQFEIHVIFAASYSRWVHDGTSFYPGRPFLEDAVANVGPFIRQRFERNLKGEGL